MRVDEINPPDKGASIVWDLREEILHSGETGDVNKTLLIAYPLAAVAQNRMRLPPILVDHLRPKAASAVKSIAPR